MACGGCSRKKTVNTSRELSAADVNYNLTGGIEITSLNQQQIRARLEVFKRKFCTACNKRYDCDYPSYLACKTTKKE